MTAAGIAAALLVAAALAGWVFGLAIGSSPAPRDPGVVWAGQVAAPWLALPWLVGWGLAGRRSAPLAALAGLTATIFAVQGYYVHPWELSAESLELPATTPVIQVFLTSATRNLQVATVWYVLGGLTGAIMALLGRRFRQTGEVLAGAALAVPFVVEPLGQFVIFGGLDRPEWVWAGEITIGLVILAWVVASRPGRGMAAEGRPG